MLARVHAVAAVVQVEHCEFSSSCPTSTSTEYKTLSRIGSKELSGMPDRAQRRS